MTTRNGNGGAIRMVSLLLLLAVSSGLPAARAASPPLPWAVVQPGYEIEIFATGFQLPVNIAFVPNPSGEPGAPFFYVTELYGTIKVVTRDGEVFDYATNLVNYQTSGAFPGTGEQGLAGIVVDPATGDVFASMLYDSLAEPGIHYPKVDRFESADGGLTAATQTTILNMQGEPQGQSHQVSNLTIGPDGKLYVHNGDGFEATTAQDLESYRGKILRMNLDGSPVSDNPFYDAGDGISARDYVFAYGVRNPFGGAWRSADGEHYEVENGPAIDRFAKIVAGQNYLWNGTGPSMLNGALYNWSPAAAPVNIVFTERATHCGSGFTQKLDHAFVTESGFTYATGPQSKGKRITEFVLDANGDLLSGPNDLIEYVGAGKATVVALAAGPDGLYFSDFYKDLDAEAPTDPGANILRITYRTPFLPRLRLEGLTGLTWDAVSGAVGYDVVRGDLGLLLATGGDFSQATLVCVANDHPLTQATDTALPPLPGDGLWYLVREVPSAAGDGCYESNGTGQIGPRDPEISASPDPCP